MPISTKKIKTYITLILKEILYIVYYKKMNNSNKAKQDRLNQEIWVRDMRIYNEKCPMAILS